MKQCSGMIAGTSEYYQNVASNEIDAVLNIINDEISKAKDSKRTKSFVALLQAQELLKWVRNNYQQAISHKSSEKAKQSEETFQKIMDIGLSMMKSNLSKYEKEVKSSHENNYYY